MATLRKNRPRSIPKCPASGEGVHDWLMVAGWALRLNGKSPEAAIQYLKNNMSRPPSPPDEVEEAVGRVYDPSRIIGDRDSGWAKTPKWPKPSRRAIEALPRLCVADLWEASPIRMDEDSPEILPRLFPGDPLLCVGNRTRFSTEHLSEIAVIANTLEQIVPSPMTSKYGWAKRGHMSQHTLDATGPRRFLIVEGDKLDGAPIKKDTQASVLLHLARIAPLALVVDSGGKSLHGWFYCAGRSDEQLIPFFSRACELGADDKLWCRSQFARMPNGLRDNGQPQPILFFNPAAIKL